METIHKAKIEKDYCVIPNALAQDNRLSFEARGVLVMLLSMPDDWSVNKKWLMEQTKAGRDKVTRIISELEITGYVSKRTSHDELGKITGIEWHVYPYDTVERLNRRTGEPSSGKSAPTKETYIQSKQENKNNAHDALVCKAFDYFWKTWSDCKKNLDTRNTSPKAKTKERFKKEFGIKYFEKHSEQEFKDEVNAMCKYAIEAHKPGLDFNPFTNMQTGKFFTNKGWRNES